MGTRRLLYCWGVSPVPIVELALPKLHATFAFVVRHEGINSLYEMRYRAAEPGP